MIWIVGCKIPHGCAVTLVVWPVLDSIVIDSIGLQSGSGSTMGGAGVDNVELMKN